MNRPRILPSTVRDALKYHAKNAIEREYPLMKDEYAVYHKGRTFTALLLDPPEDDPDQSCYNVYVVEGVTTLDLLEQRFGEEFPYAARFKLSRRIPEAVQHAYNSGFVPSIPDKDSADDDNDNDDA